MEGKREDKLMIRFNEKHSKAWLELMLDCMVGECLEPKALGEQ